MAHLVSSERTYHCRAALLLIVILYILTGLFNGLAQRDTGNTAYEIFRTKALHADAARGSRRILLAGGSNVIWGYRSPRLEAKLGIPTTNLGLEREGEDPAAERALVLDLVRRGDIVVYSSIEFWGLSSYDEIASHQLLNAAGIDQGGDWWERGVSAKTRLWAWTPRDTSIAMTIPALFHRYVLKEPSNLASRYNEHGDIKECQKADFGPYQYAPATQPAGAYVAAMAAFRDRLKERGANLVLDIPDLYTRPEDEGAWRQGFKPLLAELGPQLTITTEHIEDLTSADKNLFCDSAFHLSNESAEQRTDKLAAFLSAHAVVPAPNSEAAVFQSMATGKDSVLQ